jgi:septal ring factor EnvC (AmiA/AmiB activator)
MSFAIKVLLAVIILAVLETPAVIEHERLVSTEAQLTSVQAKYSADEQSIGTLKAQLSVSQSDLADSQKAASEASASVDAMKRAASDAAAQETAFRLKVAAQQATYGKVIATRDQQIASLKAQQEGCDEAIADLRAGQ